MDRFNDRSSPATPSTTASWSPGIKYGEGLLIEARILDSDGAPLGSPFEIVAPSGGDMIVSMAVAFDDVNQRYLMAWSQERLLHLPTAACVKGQLRDSNGGLVEVGGAPDFDISPNCDHGTYYVDVAFDSQSELFMVVWENQSGGVLGPGVLALQRSPTACRSPPRWSAPAG